MIPFHLSISNSYQTPKETSYPNHEEFMDPIKLKIYVTKYDYAFAKYRDGKTLKGVLKKCHRSNNDFIWADSLYCDIDNERIHYTIEDFSKTFEEFEHYIITSKSHQIEKASGDKIFPPVDRYHVIFPIGKKILSPEDLKKYLKLLHEKYFYSSIVDSNCIDSARFFLAFSDSQVIYNEGISVLPSLVEYEASLPEEKKIEHKEPNLNPGLRNTILFNLRKAAVRGEFDDYNIWIGIGFTMKKLGFTLDDFKLISRPDAQQEAEKKWESIDLNSCHASPLHLLSYVKKMDSHAQW